MAIIETWIYPISLTTGDYAIFSQCDANITSKCMFFFVCNYKLTCSLLNKDVTDAWSLSLNVWLHVVYVNNFATQTLQVYLNGSLDGSRCASLFVGISGDTTIGVTNLTPPGGFTAIVDELYLYKRELSASEILAADNP